MQLQLEAPAGCPAVAELENAIEQRVHQLPSVPLRVLARITTDGVRWVLVAQFDQGQRVVPGDTCAAVADALVAIVSLAIDPTAAIAATPAANGTAKADAPGDANTAPASNPVPVARPRERRPLVPPGFHAVPAVAGAPSSNLNGLVPHQPIRVKRFGLSVFVLAESGALPQLTLGPAVIGRYGTTNAWGEIALSGLYPRFRAAPGASAGKGGDIGWFGGHWAGCAAILDGSPLAGCLGVELGDLVGRGVQTEFAATQFAFWAGLLASAVVRLELQHDLALELRSTAVFPLLRPEFGLAGYGAFFEPSWISVRGLAGISWR